MNKVITKGFEKVLNYLFGSPESNLSENEIKVRNLNLSSVARNLSTKHGWDYERIYNAENDYRSFLLLVIENPTQSIVPWTQDLDDFWHQHILDTKKYYNDCMSLCGTFIHHNPNTTVEDLERHNNNDEITRNLKEKLSERLSSNSTPTTSDQSLFTNMMLIGALSSSQSKENEGTESNSMNCSTIEGSHTTSDNTSNSDPSCGSSCGSSCSSGCSS